MKKLILKQLEAYTFIEVLISMTILSALFFLLMQTILSLYKSNQYITTLNSVTVQTAQIQHILKKLFISTDPRSVLCHADLTDQDMNGDGHIDNLLLQFKTIYTHDQYLLVKENDIPVPFKSNSTYARLSLYKYNTNSHNYERFIVITDPVIEIEEGSVQINCSPIVEDKTQNVYYTTVSLQMTFNSLETYLFFPNLANTKIVQDYPFYFSTLIIN